MILILTLFGLNVIANSVTEESQQEYVVNVLAALLYKTIPIDENREYQHEVKADTVVTKLVKDDIVVEMEKDKFGHYKSKYCKKLSQFGYQVNYDWTLVKEWMCVSVKNPKPRKEQFSNLSPDSLIFYTQDFPPYSYKNGNIVEGPGAGLIREVCSQALSPSSSPLKCDIRLNTDWENSQNEVKAGKAHGLFFIGKYKKDREKWITLSRPLIKTEYGFFVRQNDNWQFNTINDFHDKIIGAIASSSTYSSLEALVNEIKRNGINMKIVQFSTTESVLYNLVQGKINIAYSNRKVGERFINKKYGSGLKYAGKHKSLDYYIGIGKSINPTRFYDTLEKLIDNDTIRQKLTDYEEIELSEQRQVGWVYRLLLKRNNQ